MSIKTTRIFQGDWCVWCVYFLLCMISLVEVFSAASQLSYSSGNFMAPLFKQLTFVTIGAITAWLIHNIPCRIFRIVPVILYPFSLIMLLLALCVGSSVNNSSRWFLGFQPSELAKLALVGIVALILSMNQEEKGANKRTFNMVMVAASPIILLIFPENLSTAMLCALTTLLMMILGRVSTTQLLKLVGGVTVIGALAVSAIALTPEKVLDSNPITHRATTWKSRLSSKGVTTADFRTPDGKLNAKALQEYMNENSQKAHARIAVASSHGTGKKPGCSTQRDYLAQAYSDFIFAIIIEEMGLVGAAAVIFFYVVLIVRTGRIASRCERNFPAFLAMGLVILLELQALTNMLVAVGIMPVTGQPLPLISRGGTSTIITSVYFGVILSVSRYARINLKGKQPQLLTAQSEKDEEATDVDFQSNEGL